VITTAYGTEIRIIREAEPFKCNSLKKRQVEVEALFWHNPHIEQTILLENLKESEPGEIERAIRKGSEE